MNVGTVIKEEESIDETEELERNVQSSCCS